MGEKTGEISVMPTVSMTVNGQKVSGEVEARTLLVQFLRENLRLTGTHVGCDTSQCGACVVHVNGNSAKSCTMLAVQAMNAEITTLRGSPTAIRCIQCKKPFETIMDCNAVFVHQEW